MADSEPVIIPYKLTNQPYTTLYSIITESLSTNYYLRFIFVVECYISETTTDIERLFQ